MILDRLVLHDFGVYRGRQELDLTPASRTRPVVLFGGLNGGGKTTILKALQLALFGRASGFWRRDDSSYDAFLRKSVHRDADPSDGAGVELVFRHTSNGEERTIHVARYWRATDSRVTEMLDVYVDGHHERDPLLSERWTECVEDFMPARIAPLFFFDGEQIEELADPSRSNQILSTAVHSLLGLDLVDQLVTDLRAIERRQSNGHSGNGAENDLAKLEARHDAVLKTLEAAKQSRAQAQNVADRAATKLKRVVEELKKHGGDLFEEREKLEADKKVATNEQKALEEQLREFAAGALPLAIAEDLLRTVEAQAAQELTAEHTKDALSFLEDRDTQLLETVEEHSGDSSLTKMLRAFLRKDRKLREAEATAVPQYLSLRADSHRKLGVLLDEKLPRERSAAASVLVDLERVQLSIENIERKLAAMPDEETVTPLLEQRTSNERALREASAALSAAEDVVRHARDELQVAGKELEDAEKRLADIKFKHEDARRTVHHSQRARESLGSFRSAILGKHVNRIETLVLDSFQKLLRKQRLVRDLRIDPRTFRVQLHGQGDGLLDVDMLSAGERQLLAVSLLWGLSRAAGRPVPAVIDTPLGRLDSEHRKKLIDHYFPFASHQVILLSTDEEIDEEFYDRIKKWVGRSYYLSFDDEAQETQVEEGYFW